MPRSGTNYLMELVCSHPHVTRGRPPVGEDFFVEHSDHLVRFVSNVRSSWDPLWGEFPPDIEAELLRSLGGGLVSFLRAEGGRCLVTKSPSVKNIARFHELFPDAELLILIRDGRSIVQSCIDTFGWDFDTAAHRFSDAASELLEFLHSAPAGRRLVVRYEDLVTDLPATVGRVLDFTGLPPEEFDFDSAAALPVKGSSSFLGSGRTRVHWEPVAKDESFRPLERWSSWDGSMLDRFEWIAGPQLRALGYGDERELSSRAFQRLRDARWRAARAARRAAYGSRGYLGSRTRPLRRRLRSFARGGDG